MEIYIPKRPKKLSNAGQTSRSFGHSHHVYCLSTRFFMVIILYVVRKRSAVAVAPHSSFVLEHCKRNLSTFAQLWARVRAQPLETHKEAHQPTVMVVDDRVIDPFAVGNINKPRLQPSQPHGKTSLRRRPQTGNRPSYVSWTLPSAELVVQDGCVRWRCSLNHRGGGLPTCGAPTAPYGPVRARDLVSPEHRLCALYNICDRA